MMQVPGCWYAVSYSSAGYVEISMAAEYEMSMENSEEK